MREIKIYTTTGVKGKVINSDATTYGALKPSLREANISLENMQVVIAGSGVSLEMDSASLPDGDFTLYFNPSTKIKSGEVTRNEIKTFIQDNPHLKDKFSKDGRNWTQVSTVDLQAIYAKVVKSKEVIASATPVKATPKVTAKTATTPINKKAVTKTVNTIGSSEVITELDNLYAKIDNCDNSDFEDEKDDILDMINCIKTKIQSGNLISGNASDESEDAKHLAEMKRLFGR